MVRTSPVCPTFDTESVLTTFSSGGQVHEPSAGFMLAAALLLALRKGMDHKNPRSAQEEYIFHYTDAQAIVGIIETQTIWATDSEFLNDGLEGKRLSGLLRTMIETPEIYRTGGHHQKYFDALKQHLTHGKKFFVSSFSRRPNMLTQFRMYSPSAGGFVIGFPRSFLQKAGALIDVNYDLQHQRQWALGFFKKFMDAAKELDSSEITAAQIERQITTLRLIDERCIEDIRCKSSDYSTEEEVRLIASGRGRTLVRASKSGNLFIPYRAIPLPNEEVLVKIAPGPGRSRQLAQASVSWLGTLRAMKSKWQIGVLSIGEFGHREL